MINSVTNNNLKNSETIKTKKRNQTFNFLYVLAILMVIDNHCAYKINFFNTIFPYNSFYMPLFVFISGYFFKRTKILDNIKHKIKKIFIPYMVWNIIFVAIAFILDKTIGTNWITFPTPRKFFLIFIYGSPTSINDPCWFIIMLFWVSILYNFIRNIFKENKINDIALSLLFLILGLISTYLCINQYNTKGDLWIFLLKISFYIQFFHFGYFFNKYIEKHLLKIRKLPICCLCIFINLILITKFGNRVNFSSTALMNNFKTWYLPIITSFTGIIFYYEIMEFLSRKIGQTKLTDLIAENTFTIVETHLFFINIPNFYIYLQILLGSTKYSNFSTLDFINNAWYRYNTSTNIIGFFCGLIGSILVILLIKKIKLIKSKWKSSDSSFSN